MPARLRRRVLTILVAASAVGVAPGPVPPAGAAPPGPAVAVTSALMGADLTQVSADPWRPPAAVASAEGVLGRSARLVDQALMGWGVGNPEPRPGQFDWRGLDRRMAFIEASGATPVLTLAGAPDWMKGGRPGTTDWARLDAAPVPAHDQDFAALAAAAARRYPEVHDFEVWNELKGFWDGGTDTWDIAAYTRLYNDVYRAVRAVDPTAEVGGPYVPVVTWADPSAGGYPSALVGPWGTVDQRSLDALSWWLAHADGAQFVAVDGGLQTHEGRGPADPGAATALFAAVDRWLGARTRLPVWWSEWYVGMPGVRGHPRRWLALATAALVQLTTSGAAAAFVWDPERYPGSHSPGLWTSTATPGGGRPTGLSAVMAALTDTFWPGRPATAVGSAGTEVLTAGGQRLAVNAEPRPATVAGLRLGPWQVRLGRAP